MTARTKILAGFGILILALIVLSWRGAAELERAVEAFDSLEQNQFLPYSHVSEARIATLAIRAELLEHFLTSDLGRKNELEKKMAEARATLDENMKWLRESPSTADHLAEFDRIQDEFDRAGAVRKQSYALSEAGRIEDGLAMLTTAYIPVLEGTDAQLAALGTNT